MATGPKLTLRSRDHEYGWHWDPTVLRWVTYKRYADNHAYPIDLTDMLDSGETGSSVTAVNVYGLTVNSISVSSATLTVDVTNAGHLVARVVTSNSDTFEIPLEFRSTDRRELRVYG